MRTTLEIKERIVSGYPYHRLNIPKGISKELELKKGDKIVIEIIEVIKAETSIKGSRNA